jgi:hypothetical protein
MGKILRACLILFVLAGLEAPRVANATGVGPPVNLVRPAVAGTAQDGAVLSTDDGTWAGSDPISFTYQWQRCNSEGQGCTDISQETSNEYELTSADVGHTMVAEVAAENSDGTQSAASDPYPVPPNVVQALPPQNASSPTVSGTTRDGQTISSTTGTWNGSTPMAFSREWSRCNASGSSCTSIPGATGPSYVLTSSEVGGTVRVTVTADNGSLPGGGSSSASSDPTGVVQALPPVSVSPPTVSGTLQDGQTLLVSVGSWTGSTPLGFTYQWSRCTTNGNPCAVISSATSSSYVVQHADVGATIRTTVTASNANLPGGGSATAMSAATGSVGSVAIPPGDPVIAAAGDIACDPKNSAYKNGQGTAAKCRQKYTSDLLVGNGLAAALPLGDEQYECGGATAFTQAYDPTWGRVKSITRPAAGNHEYQSSGGTGCDSSGKALGYYNYFGASAGDPTKGYYSYDIGAWHLIALNSNCSIVKCSKGSPQDSWLKADLAAHPNVCTLAYFHHPRFSTTTSATSVGQLWTDLYAGGADLVLNGHQHNYERFAPQTPTGTYDPLLGIREFVVGTGGNSHGGFQNHAPPTTSETRDSVTYGVLRLTLHASSYDWSFIHEAGKTFTDSGSAYCH